VKSQIKDYSNSLISLHNQRKKTLYEVQKVLRGNIGPENPSSKPITSWLEDYSSYSDKLKDLSAELNAQSEVILNTDTLVSNADQLLDETGKITASLFALSEVETSGDSVQNESEKENEIGENEKLKRNKTAIIIRNRIKDKLEGRDPDGNTVTSVKQQVSRLKIILIIGVRN